MSSLPSTTPLASSSIPNEALVHKQHDHAEGAIANGEALTSTRIYENPRALEASDDTMVVTIRIAMFNADTPVPNVRPVHPTYGTIFHNLLSHAAGRITAGAIRIESEDFEIVQDKYPDCPGDFDAIVISGAAASAYDDEPWVRKLDAYVKMIWDEYPQVKMFGSCFGHQILCQSLLRDAGGKVEKDPKGYELGVQEIRLSDAFVKDLVQSKTVSKKTSQGSFDFTLPPTPADESQAAFISTDEPKRTMRLQMIHADHVVSPTQTLPVGWSNIGSTDHCHFQGAYLPGRILTYQGHFEFNHFINKETLRVFGAKWETARLTAGLDSMDHDDDSKMGADCVLRFILGGKPATAVGSGGLVTPPA